MTISAIVSLPPHIGGTLYVTMSAQDAGQIVEDLGKVALSLGEAPAALKNLAEELVKVLNPLQGS